MDPPDAKKPKVDNTAVICTIKRKNAGLGRVEKVIEVGKIYCRQILQCVGG